ncbi:branched-chain amino acid transport ATP-binding protein LivG [Desulfocucumis palustris]|uniref:Branched-chain amino acid transport ATP-binding protein LivG n=1 Tax=Desulfocucumis palustris TaxID=1898651 RepID=A0A2L2XDR8_9FIRM|nr:ABC transporter ATP-binding protein [Desulfocucumis palustris]GBF34300.1 branched-chain amino acid transport ATP-binding protein LivG [Desulfocucumis palustris]
MIILEVTGLSKHFGGVTAVNSVDFHVSRGEIVSIIGPNGAGKTTLFNLISGVAGPDSGSIKYNGEEIGGMPPDRIAVLGVTRTFQNLQIFRNMTVVENVMVGAHRLGRKGLLQAGVRWPGVASEESFIYGRAIAALELVGLGEKKDMPAEILPYGEQRLLEIARAMALEPDLILLDEPAAGMNQGETNGLGELISRFPEMGTSVLLVEHNMEMVMAVSHRIVVLDHGSKLAEGTPLEIQQDSRVISAYLGEEVF